MEGYDIYTTTERARWIIHRLIDLEVPYEMEPWSENADWKIVVPQNHSLLLDYLLNRAENWEVDDPSDL